MLSGTVLRSPRSSGQPTRGRGHVVMGVAAAGGDSRGLAGPWVPATRALSHTLGRGRAGPWALDGPTLALQRPEDGAQWALARASHLSTPLSTGPMLHRRHLSVPSTPHACCRLRTGSHAGALVPGTLARLPPTPPSGLISDT